MATRGQKNRVLFHRVICVKIQIPRPHPRRTAPKLSGERPSFFPCLEVCLRCGLCLSLHILCSRLAWMQEVLWRCYAISLLLDFALSMPPWWLIGKGSFCQCRRHGFNPWVGKIPWRRACQPTPVFLPGESHGQRRVVGHSPWCHKELDMTEAIEHAYISLILYPVHWYSFGWNS